MARNLLALLVIILVIAGVSLALRPSGQTAAVPSPEADPVTHQGPFSAPSPGQRPTAAPPPFIPSAIPAGVTLTHKFPAGREAHPHPQPSPSTSTDLVTPAAYSFSLERRNLSAKTLVIHGSGVGGTLLIFRVPQIKAENALEEVARIEVPGRKDGAEREIAPGEEINQTTFDWPAGSQAPAGSYIARLQEDTRICDFFELKAP